MDRGIRIGLLGPMVVTAGGRPVVLTGRRRRAILAGLALSANRPVAVNVLADWVWGEESAPGSRSGLHTAVTRLRQALRRDVVAGSPGAYTLRVPPEAVDVHEFRSLVTRARSATDPSSALETLDRALGMWRGDPLQDQGCERLAAEYGPRLTEEWFHATERRLGLLTDLGRHGELVAELRDLTTRHPLRESLWRLLMVALYRSGRQGEALNVFQEVRDLLADRLGVDPGRELLDTHRAVLMNDPSLASPPAAPRQRVPPPAAPPAAPPVPRQLPSDLSVFTGREADLSILDTLLPDPAREEPPGTASPIAVAVVGGVGGVGKTALAVHWAHRVADRFPDGQLYLNLRGYGRGEPLESGTALEMLLRGFAVPAEMIPADLESRSAMLRTVLAGRRVLMLLDNARDPEQVRPLLPGSDTVVVVTSRSQMRGLAAREAARRVTLRELSAEESLSYLASTLGPDRIAAEPAAAAALADHCGHLPLALAVAAEHANRVPGQRLSELVAELRDEGQRLDALNAGGDAASDVRGVFSWSYRALGPQVARMFRLMALHPGTDLSLEAAAALAGLGVGEAGRQLDQLVESHQVTRTGTRRYEQHDLVRAYATELVEAEEPATVRHQATRRLLDWYLATALAARALLRPNAPSHPVASTGEAVPLSFASDLAALAWYQAERQNLIAAVHHAGRSGLDATCWRLAYAIWGHLEACGAWNDMIATHEAGLAAARRIGDKRGEAEMLTGLGAYRDRADRDRSIAYQRQALALFREVGDRAGEATALHNLGVVFRKVGRLPEALDALRRCLAIDEAVGDQGSTAVTLNSLASTYIAAGRYAEAVEASRSSVALMRQLSHRRGEAIALTNLAAAQGHVGDLDAAVGNYHRAIAHYRDLADQWREATALGHLARLQRDRGDLGAARRSWRAALAISGDGQMFGPEDLRDLLADFDAERSRNLADAEPSRPGAPG